MPRCKERNRYLIAGELEQAEEYKRELGKGKKVHWSKKILVYRKDVEVK